MSRASRPPRPGSRPRRCPGCSLACSHGEQPARVGPVKPAPGHAESSPTPGSADRDVRGDGRSSGVARRAPDRGCRRAAAGRPARCAPSSARAGPPSRPAEPARSHRPALDDALGDRDGVGVDRVAVALSSEPRDELLFTRALDGLRSRDRLHAVRNLRPRKAARDRGVVGGERRTGRSFPACRRGRCGRSGACTSPRRWEVRPG